ncbi:MAG TPA: proton-conducting transporter membrane subunit [Bacteroidales bacterium]|nr:proton-conducting transporter membrane subunit [Bacteroidales bacterium]
MFFTFIILSIAISLSIFLVKNARYTKVISSLFLFSVLMITGYAYLHLEETSSLYFKFDSLGVLLAFVLGILSVATFYHSVLYLQRHHFSAAQEAGYYASLIMLITAMLSAYFADNIAVLWISIETTTLFVSILIFHERTKEALEAAWKYLFVSSVGVALAFIGILFLSITASSIGITDLSLTRLLNATQTMNTVWLKMAFLLVLTGFSAKMGIFPLYTVAVDAHTVAPPPISAFISTTLMNVGFLGIFRIFTILAQTDVLQWAQNVLLIAGVISVFMSAIQLLRIKHYKRMFAFSSLEHMGLVALGLGIGGIGYYAAVLHIVFHSFAKAGLFYQIGQVHQFFNSYWIKDVAGYFKKNPIGGLSMILGIVSILAIPPSGLFVSEFLVFKAMFVHGHYYIAVFVLILLTVIIYTFSKNAFHLLYGETDNLVDRESIKVNPYETISQFVLFGLVIYLGVNPPLFFTDLINNALAIL